MLIIIYVITARPLLYPSARRRRTELEELKIWSMNDAAQSITHPSDKVEFVSSTSVVKHVSSNGTSQPAALKEDSLTADANNLKADDLSSRPGQGINDHGGFTEALVERVKRRRQRVPETNKDSSVHFGACGSKFGEFSPASTPSPVQSSKAICGTSEPRGIPKEHGLDSGSTKHSYQHPVCHKDGHIQNPLAPSSSSVLSPGSNESLSPLSAAEPPSNKRDDSISSGLESNTAEQFVKNSDPSIYHRLSPFETTSMSPPSCSSNIYADQPSQQQASTHKCDVKTQPLSSNSYCPRDPQPFIDESVSKKTTTRRRRLLSTTDDDDNASTQVDHVSGVAVRNSVQLVSLLSVMSVPFEDLTISGLYEQPPCLYHLRHANHRLSVVVPPMQRALHLPSKRLPSTC